MVKASETVIILSAMTLVAIVLAAGKGTRMKSKTPKVLHNIAHKPMIAHILETVHSLGTDQIITIVSEDTKEALRPFEKDGVTDLALQVDRKGTGDAVSHALPILKDSIEDVLIVCGDTPLLRKETFTKIVKSKSDICVLAMDLRETNELHVPYGRLMYDDQDCPTGIIEYKDGTPEQRLLPHANTGIIKVKKDFLKDALRKLKPSPVTGEYYLTDLLGMAYKKGLKTETVSIDDADDVLGINTRLDLSKAEEIYQNRLRKEVMLKGVTLLDPKTVYFAADTVIEKDVTVYPNVTFLPNARIKSGSTIFANCVIGDADIKRAEVGPFAHLRGGVIMEEGSTIGNFVEVKKSTLGKKSKAKHLTYIGDATLENSVNIGAGTVTCNYDGFNKHQTYIEEGCFVGSNTALVAPIKLEKGSIVAAGSVITENVKPDALASARPAQTQIDNWAEQYRNKKKKSKK